jgi:hypothetical protein
MKKLEESDDVYTLYVKRYAIRIYSRLEK